MQKMRRHELLKARTFCIVVGRLHTNFGPTKTTDVQGVAAGLQAVVNKVGSKQFLANATTFFEVLNECYGLRNISYRKTAVQVKENFLNTLARLFATFPSEFWEFPSAKAKDDCLRSRLVVPRTWRDKLRSFNIQDPEVVRLASGGGTTMLILYQMLLEHLNRGRRNKRLIDQGLTELAPVSDDQPAAEDAATAAGTPVNAGNGAT
jgi:hypothetical protein